MSKDTEYAEIEKILKKQESQLPRDKEIERILKTFRMDPFALLEVPIICDTTEIKNAYRKKSLLIHPDKAQHPKAQEAFEVLKKAESMLSDQNQKERLTKMMWDAEKDMVAKWRSEIKKGQRPESDLDESSSSEVLKEAVREHYRDFTIETEWRKRQQMKKAMQAQGAEDKVKKDEAAMELEAETEKRKKNGRILGEEERVR